MTTPRLGQEDSVFWELPRKIRNQLVFTSLEKGTTTKTDLRKCGILVTISRFVSPSLRKQCEPIVNPSERVMEHKHNSDPKSISHSIQNEGRKERNIVTETQNNPPSNPTQQFFQILGHKIRTEPSSWSEKYKAQVLNDIVLPHIASLYGGKDCLAKALNKTDYFREGVKESVQKNIEKIQTKHVKETEKLVLRARKETVKAITTRYTPRSNGVERNEAIK